MRSRAVLFVGLFVLPALAEAQLRIPGRPSQRSPVEPATQPPEVPVVARALAVQRSRWSTEAYTTISSFQVPAVGGGISSYTSIGSGTHADYSFRNGFSATMDITASALGSPTITESVEAGGRWMPIEAWDRGLRPFVDVRGGFMHMYDTFLSPVAIVGGNTNQQFVEGSRYARGFGGLTGAGLEFSLTNSLALTTELASMRHRMTAYRVSNAAPLPVGTTYWMTTYRYTLGFKYSPVRALHLEQNPTK